MSNGSTESDVTTFGTFKVPSAAPLPDVLDFFIAGGGPAGTAAALRAKELGLNALVTDYDDLMKRIRDYPKGKPIKPSYGGGDKMPFPPGGAMLTSIHFDEIDKDEMCVQWKQKYRDYSLTAKVGSELTGLERKDNLYLIKTWNHRAGQEVVYRAKAVILAIGAGVPRRFDIPGNVDGIAFKLSDPAKYVGSPALVLGGGTSAAEAVIAISKAKVAAEDGSAVYWSYRGDKLPRVAKALSEEFFDAYVGNGNVRYLPISEPSAVVTGDDKKDYLAVRIDRKVIAGRPTETVHLEFPKEQVVACIGEDVPYKLLQGFGAKVALVNNRPMMLMSKEGECSLPNVFLVGDLRGPKYIQCTDFTNSSTYEQVSRKPNIKIAMWDAVQAVEICADRAGVANAKVAVAVAPQPSAKPAPQEQKKPATPAPSEPAEAHQAATQIVSLLPDGTAEEQFPITKDSVTIGRKGADITEEQDVYMADHHATVANRSGQFVLSDSGQGSGVWLRVQGVEGRPLAEGDVVWIGSQLLVANKAEGRWGVAHHNNEGAYRTTYTVADKPLFVGRGGEAALDPKDMGLSRRHAQFRVDAQGLKVFDLGSTNGTYVKITQPVPLSNGDEFRAGSKRFRFENFAPVAKLGAKDVVSEAPPEALASTPAAAPAAAAPAAAKPAAAAAPAAAVAAGQFPVSIEHPEFPASFGCAAGQDLLHGFFDYLKTRFPDMKVGKGGEPPDHHAEPIDWDCKVGLCGMCVVEIVEGADNFEPADPREIDCLANKAMVDPDPKKYRLACVAKLKGPVKLTNPS